MRKNRVKRHVVTQPLDESYRLIPLTQGQNAIVDVEDFERLCKWNWCAHWKPRINSFYAVRSDGFTSMHRAVIGPDSEEIDHRSHDSLDNRKQNLRQCTRAQNQYNRKVNRNNKSGFKGVRWEKDQWRSRIKINGKLLHLGFFRSKEEAAKAYDDAAKIHFSDFAHLNVSP